MRVRLKGRSKRKCACGAIRVESCTKGFLNYMQRAVCEEARGADASARDLQPMARRLQAVEQAGAGGRRCAQCALCVL